MPASIIAYYSESFAVAIVLIMLATAAHQAWSANIFTSATDLFPQKVSGSVVGLGATTGGIGGMFMTLLAALAVQWTGNQQVVFIIAGIMHPLSLVIFLVWLRGRFDQVDMSQQHDLSSAQSSLITAGGIIGLLGVVFMVLIGINWDVCVEAATLSGAATAMTAAAGVLLVGLALVYAGLPHKRPQT
jgi:ACS family hexuronate transporter-like MFS transporter